MRHLISHKISIIALLAMVLFSCKNEIAEVDEMFGENMPTQTTYDAIYTYSDSAKITSTITTPKLERYETEDTSYAVFPLGLHVEFAGDATHPSSNLTAKYGIWRQDERTMEVQKEVLFVNGKGEKLETEKLIWYQDSARIYTDEFVKITQDGAVIYGHGMEAAEDFSWYRLKKISGEFDIEDEEFE